MTEASTLVENSKTVLMNSNSAPTQASNYYYLLKLIIDVVVQLSMPD